MLVDPKTRWLLGNLDRTRRWLRPLLVERLGAEEADAVLGATREELARLAPDVPRGGTMLDSPIAYGAWVLALHRVLAARGHDGELAGPVAVEVTRRTVGLLPRPVRALLGRAWHSGWFRRRLHRDAEAFATAPRPGLFGIRMSPEETDGSWGYEVHACPIRDLMARHGAPELTRWICATDQVTGEALGWGLSRTGTLARDGRPCDFRFRRGGATRIEAGPG